MAGFKTVKETLEVWATKRIQSMHRILDSQNANASSSLRQSISPVIKFVPEGIDLKIFMNEYWYYVDKGRGKTKAGGKGGIPLRDRIKKWIAQKGIKLNLTDFRKKKIKGLSNKIVKKGYRQLSVDQQAKALSFLIARAIHRRGWKRKGTGFFSKTINTNTLNGLNKAVAIGFKKDFVIEIQKTLKDFK